MNDLKESNSEMSDPQSVKMYQDLPEIVVTNGGVVKNEMEIDGKSGKMYCKMKYEFLTLFIHFYSFQSIQMSYISNNFLQEPNQRSTI